jgi:DMSO/TMAO reductase YedYZ molybdopterin-dependent catalytic subunit
LIIRSRDPKVQEFPFSSLETAITSNEQFYVRNHFPEPIIDRSAWELKIEGCVDKPFKLTYDELLSLPQRSVVSTLECAGNNRVFLTPPARGVQWELGGAGTAEWSGVPLNVVLERAGLRTGALEVILEGADSGPLEVEPKPAGPVAFSRSVPMAKAMSDVLLVYKMNGEELTVSHGFPVRAIVPGWYAMASIKWLTRVIVTDKTFQGYFQTTDYAYWHRHDGQIERVPISAMLVKAEISRPHANEVVAAGTNYRVFGAAWVGESQVQKVEFSDDGGKSWKQTRLLGDAMQNAWRLWEFEWKAPAEKGTYTLMARATDANGNTQGTQHNRDFGDYMINHCLPVVIEVR